MTKWESKTILWVCVGLLGGHLLSKLPEEWTLAVAMALVFFGGILAGMLIEQERIRKILFSQKQQPK